VVGQEIGVELEQVVDHEDDPDDRPGAQETGS
jgi:hypothetical protein